MAATTPSNTQDDFAKRSRLLKGMPVIYDSVGRAHSRVLSAVCARPDCWSLRQRPPVPPFELGVLAPKGSLRDPPTLMTYTATRAGLEGDGEELFDACVVRQVKIEIHRTYAAKDAQQSIAIWKVENHGFDRCCREVCFKLT